MLTKHTNCIYPVEYRFVAGDSGMLSPYYRRASVTISVSGGPGVDYWSYLTDVDAILRDPERFVSGHGVTMRASHTTVAGDGGKPAMITMDGAAHSRNRRLVNRGFTPAVIRSFEAHFRKIAVAVIERAVAKGEFDFVADIASQLPMHAICDLLGVPDADRAQLARWTNFAASPTDPDYVIEGEDVFSVLGHSRYPPDRPQHLVLDRPDQSVVVRWFGVQTDTSALTFVATITGWPRHFRQVTERIAGNVYRKIAIGGRFRPICGW